MANDEQLAHRIWEFLLARHPLAGLHLRVDVEDGVVVLRGVASTFYQKQLWLHDTKKIAGTAKIVDEIEVLPAMS